MKINRLCKLILTLLPVGLLVLSCGPHQRDYSQYARPSEQYHNSNDQTKILKSDRRFDTLLSKVYGSDLTKKTEFVNQQEDQEYQKSIYASIKTISTKWFNATDSEAKKTSLAELRTLYSDNWYLVLKNLKIFTNDFSEWFVLPATTDYITGEPIQMTEQYLANLKTLAPYESFQWADNFLDEIKESETSREVANRSDLLILKDKALFSISIHLEDDQWKLYINPAFYYFPNATREISINLLSNIFHYALIHRYGQWYTDFEDIIKKWGYHEPALMVMNLRNYEN
ncbi:aromatic cluster surface protein [Mycoplasmoides fastidiosum]|uniref:Aromatic cluster surface protein n=1 Tax=Mycoplasmoides fastidiosum TaxID=92758 RepID=A0ABU0LZ09_9BACT|nr:aromatic motif membrane protein [Mycoplasmoides fastidiosum]MDQ0513939.1 aromatic cluster surface protein [Mycoplasmoides fastidiosum]UUD37647.1 hypothetical protein NPA10_03710 [Mycoplasmoides fastidiosum]